MKTTMRLLPLITVAVVVAVAAPALAFHDGGVAHCNGCHTMHNSEQNAGVNAAGDGMGGTGAGRAVGFGYDDLLLFDNATDVCTDCHGNSGRSYAVWSADPDTITRFESAGDFVFLLETNVNDGHSGATRPILGERAAHNVKSGIKGTDWDSVLMAPPAAAGGQLNNNNLHCSSCHDPHGNDGFRLLYKNGQNVSVGGELITYNATLEAFGISYGGDEANDNHNAYKAGYSEWCATCHFGFHNAYGNLIHPSGTTMSTAVINQYNKYNGTTDCVDNPPSGATPCGTGSVATSYLAEVPFEDPDNTDMDTDRITGPGGNERVACMSCHRAHGSSAPDIGRWDFSVTLLDEDGLESLSWAIPNPYDANQRSLCNKCHGQDEYDHITPITP